MKAILTAVLVTMPVMAQANEGAHQHPHGIEFSWVAVAVLCGLGGYALARWRK